VIDKQLYSQPLTVSSHFESSVPIAFRKLRADQVMPGHGIGLAVACDIVHGYQGNIRITRSEFGGATFVVDLPGT
jgi:K+-sensing histidine kinase KdpD